MSLSGAACVSMRKAASFLAKQYWSLRRQRTCMGVYEFATCDAVCKWFKREGLTNVCTLAVSPPLQFVKKKKSEIKCKANL